MSWPLVSFPAGFDSLSLPVSVQLWGPRFCEPQLVQTMIDFQANYPDYHKAVPPDPTFKAAPTTLAKVAPAPVPEGPVDPLTSNDPVVLDNHLNR
jgi:hypothetical protein